MKKVNCGSDLLIPRSEWISETEIQGTDELVLRSPLMNKAFNRILELHKPTKRIAFVSLCSSTRPYSKSRKWKKFKEEFEKDCDLIIASNGGIIPIVFENCYPYLTYDAHGTAPYDKIYIKYLYERLMRFFSVHHYDYIIFDFRPNLRNRISAKMFKRDFKGGSKIYILPTATGYEMARKNKFKPYGGRYPDLSYEVMSEFSQVIKEIKSCMQTDQL